MNERTQKLAEAQEQAALSSIDRAAVDHWLAS